MNSKCINLEAMMLYPSYFFYEMSKMLANMKNLLRTHCTLLLFMQISNQAKGFI